MINQSEIKRISEETGVLKNQIDKDWVLSYILYGIASMPEMHNVLVFKGGTSLRKCWFSDYRFSEDLDFTILDSKFVFDRNYVKKIIDKATNLSFSEDYNRGILFKIKDIEPTHSKDIEQGFKIFIHYWGADHRKNDLPSENMQIWHHTIKLDINHTEEIIFPIHKKGIFHNYSDNKNFADFKVGTYAIEEVLSEKLRSLVQRKYTSPRDFYDIWYLKKNIANLNWDIIKDGFFQKMSAKNIEFEGAEQLINSNKERILKAHWRTQLSNQFPFDKIPDYNIISADLSLFLYDLFK